MGLFRFVIYADSRRRASVRRNAANAKKRQAKKATAQKKEQTRLAQVIAGVDQVIAMAERDIRIYESCGEWNVVHKDQVRTFPRERLARAYVSYLLGQQQ